MVKDKLITIRIDEDVYDRFKDWAKGNNTNISSALRDYIFSCLDPNKSIQHTRQNIDLDLSSHLEGLESSLYSKLYSRLVDELSSQKIDENTDDSSAIQDIDIVDTSDAPSEFLNLPVGEDEGDKLPEQENKPVGVKQNRSELAERFKENKNEEKRVGRTTVYGKVSKLIKGEMKEEDFNAWIKEHDPEGKAWHYNKADNYFYPAD